MALGDTAMSLTFYSDNALALIQAKRGMRGCMAIAKAARGDSSVVRKCMAKHSADSLAAYRYWRALMVPFRD